MKHPSLQKKAKDANEEETGDGSASHAQSVVHVEAEIFASRLAERGRHTGAFLPVRITLDKHFVVNVLANAILVNRLGLLDSAHAQRGPSRPGCSRIVFTGSFTAFAMTGGIFPDRNFGAPTLTPEMHFLPRREFGSFCGLIPSGYAYGHSKLVLHAYAAGMHDYLLSKAAATSATQDAAALRLSGVSRVAVSVRVADPGVVDTDLHQAMQAGVDGILPISGPLYWVCRKLGLLRDPRTAGSESLMRAVCENDPAVSRERDWLGAIYFDLGLVGPAEIPGMTLDSCPTDIGSFPSMDVGSSCSWFGHWPARSDSLRSRTVRGAVFQRVSALVCRFEKSFDADRLRSKTDISCEDRAGGTIIPPVWECLYRCTFCRLADFVPVCPPGRPFLPARILVNLQKGGTVFFCLFLVKFFNREKSPTLCVYSALHGGYGLLWLLKDSCFRDKNTEQRLSVVGVVALTVLLLVYWAAPIFIAVTDDPSLREASGARLFIATLSVVLGAGLMLAADCQKFYELKGRKGATSSSCGGGNKGNNDIGTYLIDSGLFARTRNPNYLGEMVLYAGFALLVPPRPVFLVFQWGMLLAIWGVVFGANIVNKERSLRRKPGYAAYRANSWIFLPKISLPGWAGWRLFVEASIMGTVDDVCGFWYRSCVVGRAYMVRVFFQWGAG